jgi:hypothetical protein
MNKPFAITLDVRYSLANHTAGSDLSTSTGCRPAITWLTWLAHVPLTRLTELCSGRTGKAFRH